MKKILLSLSISGQETKFVCNNLQAALAVVDIVSKATDYEETPISLLPLPDLSE